VGFFHEALYLLYSETLYRQLTITRPRQVTWPQMPRGQLLSNVT
jgi:hypothetical protein